MRVILDIAHMHLDKQMLGGNPDVALSLAGPIGDRLLCGGARCVRRLRRASSRFVASSTYRHPCNHYERLGRCFWTPEANCTPSLTKPGSAGSLHGYKRRDYNDGRKEKLLRLGSRNVSPARRIPQKPGGRERRCELYSCNTAINSLQGGVGGFACSCLRH